MDFTGWRRVFFFPVFSKSEHFWEKKTRFWMESVDRKKHPVISGDIRYFFKHQGWLDGIMLIPIHYNIRNISYSILKKSDRKTHIQHTHSTSVWTLKKVESHWECFYFPFHAALYECAVHVYLIRWTLEKKCHERKSRHNKKPKHSIFFSIRTHYVIEWILCKVLAMNISIIWVFLLVIHRTSIVLLANDCYSKGFQTYRSRNMKYPNGHEQIIFFFHSVFSFFICVWVQMMRQHPLLFMHLCADLMNWYNAST